MIYLILVLVGFIAGVISAGYVVAAIGGIKTELALLKVRASNDAVALEDRFSAIETKIRNNLP